MKVSSSAWSFGKSQVRKLDNTSNLATPGPGQYSQDNRTKHSAPGWKMGTSHRTGNRDNLGPGPGQYNSMNTLGSAPRYTFRIKTTNLADPTKTICSPGPGNYTPSFLGSKTPSYSMRIRPQSSKTESNPGPGHYALRKDNDLVQPSYKYS